MKLVFLPDLINQEAAYQCSDRQTFANCPHPQLLQYLNHISNIFSHLNKTCF